MSGKPQIIIGGVWGHFFRFLAKYCGLSFLDGYPKFTKQAEFEHGFKVGSVTVSESMMKTLQELVLSVEVQENAKKQGKNTK